jgi:hypothetical protein
VLRTPIFALITIIEVSKAHREILIGVPACTTGCPGVSFVASLRSGPTVNKASATPKPFFDERPIQEFFNTFDPERAFKIVAMKGAVSARKRSLALRKVLQTGIAGFRLSMSVAAPFARRPLGR